MAYSVEYSNTAYRSVKKLPKDIRNTIVDHSEKIAGNPYAAPQLKGRYSFLHSYHFSYKGSQYRIIYEISKQEERIYIHLADTRENIYRRLDQMRAGRQF